MTGDNTLTERDLAGRVLDQWVAHLADIYLNGRAPYEQALGEDPFAAYPSPFSRSSRAR